MPLAYSLRPESIDEFVGQSHLTDKNMPLRNMIAQKIIFPFILWGPPGVGKTTLAKIISKNAKAHFFELSAVSAGKPQIKEIIDKINNEKLFFQQAPVVFLDEIHRFNKSQQDYLLPFVEDGTIILIGATTENPSFEINNALLSRMKVFVLEQLNQSDLKKIIHKAQEFYKKQNIKIDIKKDESEYLINFANGDARKLLNLLESCIELYQKISLKNLIACAQSTIRYDKKSDEHYDTISAFIKSLRASNLDASLYYLAKMIEAGEDPKFIARRMIVFASEDIGLAQPTALVVANAVFDAVHKIGFPEAQINLAHGTCYLANAKKDRSAYDAYFNALSDVKKLGNLPIPLFLRNAPTKLMKSLDYSKGYQMYPQKNTCLLPEKIKNKKYLKKAS